MKRITIKASYIFYFLLLFLFSFDFTNGADYDNAIIKDDYLIPGEIRKSNELSDDLNGLIDKNKSKDNDKEKVKYPVFSDNKIKEHEEKVKLNLDSFLKKYKISPVKKLNLESIGITSNHGNDKGASKFDDAVGLKDSNNEDESNNKIKETKNIDDINLKEKASTDGTSEIKVRDEFDLQRELDFDFKKEIIDLESDKHEESSELENLMVVKNTTLLTVQDSEKISSEKNNQSQVIKKQKDKDPLYKIKKTNQMKETIFPEEAQQKQILLKNQTEISSINYKKKGEQLEEQEKEKDFNNTEDLSFLSTEGDKEKAAENPKRRAKTETQAKSAFSAKRIRDILFDKSLNARISLKFLQGAKQLKYFENIKTKINFSQSNLELILDSNSAETEYSIKNLIGDYAKIIDDDLTKLSFDYRLMDNCENFIFNKENLSNYKPKDLNSFNNMFLNNVDHEDTIDSEQNPNYDEKAFENEYLSLPNFNFYLRLEFNFAKLENKNQRLNSLNRLMDSDENRNEDENNNNNKNQGGSEFKSFLELTNQQDNNSNDIRDKAAKEVLSVLVKLNFNHKNNNGKIFLDFFESLNKNEKSVKWLYGRQSSSLKENSNSKNSNTKNNKDIISSSFVEKETEAEQAQFSLEDITNNYLKNFLNNNNENNNSYNNYSDNKRNKNLSFKKKEILDDPLDKNEYYIKNLDKNFSEVTIKEKKHLFLKFLNSVIYDSCKEKKAEAEKIKDSLRLILKGNLDVTNKISNLQQKLKGLETKRLSFTGLYEDSAQMLTEKASIKSLELQQIQYYRNIISKIDKAFVRDSLLMQKDKDKLQKKIEQLEAEKIIFNKTEKILFTKRSFKENLEFDIAENKQRIIQLQAEALDNKNILGMIENDRLVIQNKLSFRENRIKKGKSALALLLQKIEKLSSEKNQTEFILESNVAQKQKINESIQKDNSLIREIEQKIKELLEKKGKIINSISAKNENLEKIENENLITRNKLVLIASNLNYIQSSVAEKQKNFENSQKNLLQIQSEFKKITEKRKIFASHVDNLQASIADLTLGAQALQSQNEALRRELSEFEVKKALGNKRILGLLDEINGIQINLSKFDSNLQANRINKNNYQVNIKNTIDNLVKEKVLDEGQKYYEYLDNLEKDNFDGNQNYKNGKIGNVNDNYKNKNDKNYKNDGDVTKNYFDYYSYKKLKEQKFNELLKNESHKIKGESKLNDKILVYKATEDKKLSSSDLSETLKLDEKVNSNEDIYSELDMDKFNKSKIDPKLIDDYVIIDYDRLFKNIEESNLLKTNTNTIPNLEARGSASDDITKDKNGGNAKVNSDNSLTKHYSENIDVLNAEINLNKSEIEKSKIDLKKMKEEFHKTIAKLKEESYANLKILIDLIEIEFKQNSLNNNIFNKINKLIDILK